jgi:hypothetical protein
MDRETVDEIKRHISVVTEDLRREVRDFRKDIKQDFSVTTADLRGEVGDFRDDIKQDFSAKTEDLQRQFKDLQREFKDLQLQFHDLRQEVTDSSVETRRHFDVAGEDLRADFRLFAEGQGLHLDQLNKKIDGLAEIVQLAHSELTGRLNDHETRLGAVERRQA